MEETNKSQLISEAELIEAINADSIISVSLGAGQPQKNVKLSTLASVVAGLIGLDENFMRSRWGIYGTTDANNIMSPGVYKLGWSSNTGCTNFPHNNYLYGTMIVFRFDAVVCAQIIITSSEVWVREYYDGWKSWIQLG